MRTMRQWRRLLALLAAISFVTFSVPPVLAAPQPGASCKVAGRERVTTAGTLRCGSSTGRDLRWRLVSASQTTTTTTPSTTSPATSTTTPSSSAIAPQVSNVVANDIEVRFTLSGMSPDTNNYAVQWVQQGAVFNTYQMIHSTSKNVSISAQTFRCDRTYTFRVFAMRSDWTLSQGHTNQNVTPHSDTFDITMTHPCTGSAATTTTTTLPLTCAQGGTCIVGDIGPGGGTVFYVHTSGTFACGATLSGTCRYLEAAPTAGTNAWTDDTYAWSANTTTAIGVTARGTAVGTGYQNTEAIIAQAGGGSLASRAGTISRAYRGPNNLTDWYLPSKDELNEFCKLARALTPGNTAVRCNSGSLQSGFRSDLPYWSSTEINAEYTWVHNFNDTLQFDNQKFRSRPVRPIRAFG